jgi:hypothetical protein
MAAKPISTSIVAKERRRLHSRKPATARSREGSVKTRDHVNVNSTVFTSPNGEAQRRPKAVRCGD